MWQADRGDTGGVLRLDVLQPTQLGRREGGHRQRSGADNVGFGPDLVDKVGGSDGRAGVVPEQGWTDHPACRVKGDHAVLLAGDADRSNVRQSPGLGEGCLKGVPPVLGVDLAAVGMRRPSGGNQGPGLGVPHDDLAALGRGVDPDDAGHAQRAPRRCSVANCWSRTKPKPLPL